MIKYASLASSSVFGSSYLIQGADGTRLLVDYGVRQRRLLADLALLGVELDSIAAVLITHEHIDHTYGLGLRRPALAGHGARLLAHPAALAACPGAANYQTCAGRRPTPADCLLPGVVTQVGGLTIEPFSTPHDAAAPLGFVIRSGEESIGIATDLGHLPAEVGDRLTGCTHLILESNHDRDLEVNSGRAWHLIERVLGPEGHLSNDQAAEALRWLATGNTQSIMLAHLSLDCNLPGLALAVAGAALKNGRARWNGLLTAAPAAATSGWIAGRDR